MKKIIDELINHSIKGVDVYRHKDATWLIFSEQNRWVVELTDEGTLWYNYHFFSDILRYVSLECGRESNDYITGWANDYFFKDIKKSQMGIPIDGEFAVDIVINEGVKEVQGDEEENKSKVIFVMNKGVKEIKTDMYGDAFDINPYVANVIENGIKNIYPDKIPHDYDWSDEFDANKVVGGGVKVVPLPDMSGELRGYSHYYNTKEDRTKPHTEYIKEAIEGGVKV